jgi:hypothetical protein
MRKITKRFCDNNPVLLSYFRESRRYSPLDIRIRKTSLHILRATLSVPVYISTIRLTHIQSWIEDNISITILRELPVIRQKRQNRNIFVYQV